MRHGLATHAAAIAFRVLVALVPPQRDGVVLVLTAYALAVSAVFLIGVEVDETARTRTTATNRRRGGRSGRGRAST